MDLLSKTGLSVSKKFDQMGCKQEKSPTTSLNNKAAYLTLG